MLISLLQSSMSLSLIVGKRCARMYPELQTLINFLQLGVCRFLDLSEILGSNYGEDVGCGLMG